MQLRPTFTLRNLLPTDHAGNSKTKAARCQSATILTKTFSLEAVSLTFKEKKGRLSHVNMAGPKSSSQKRG